VRGILLPALAFVLLVGVSAAAAGSARREFYLSAHPRQCLVGTASPGAKTVLVLPCSNPAHNLEVYAIGHGGWAPANPPSGTYAIARGVCVGAFIRLTRHALPRTAGWQGFWADPGAETKRYGDRIVCSYRAWPKLRPLGRGWHVR
jgi:hypothetical protein